MPTNTLEVRLALKTDTAELWAASELVLLKGEPALELDTGRWKFGDGTKKFSELDYVGLSSAEIQALIQQYAINSISLTEGDANGKIGITIDGKTTYIAVKGLQSAAYKTSESFATAAQGTKADNAMPKTGGKFTGDVTLNKDPVAALGAATKQYVDEKVSSGIAASDAMIFKGTIGTDGNYTSLPTTYKTGWTYRVITAGTYVGQVCEIGDLIIALVDRAGSGNINSDWTVAQTNIDGAITAVGSGLTKTGSMVKHSNSITSGSVEGSSGAISFGGQITIPKITYDSTGHISKVETTTITLPTNPNTDTKVKNTPNATAKAYVTGTTSGTAATTEQIFDPDVYLDIIEGQLVVKTLKGNVIGNVTGNISGNSGTTTKLSTERSFSITGGAKASAIPFNGTANVTLNVTEINTDFLHNGANTLILDCGDSI